MHTHAYEWTAPFVANVDGYCHGCDGGILKGETIRLGNAVNSSIFCHDHQFCLDVVATDDLES